MRLCDQMLLTEKLETWQVAMDCVDRCYRVTTSFPREEIYGLTSQLRRAAVSIPSNVAEGYCRHKTKVYAHHISIALGSHAELETCIEIARRLRYSSDEMLLALEQQVAMVGRLLHALYQALERKLQNPLVP